MMNSIINQLLSRNLTQLILELNAYPIEADIWKVEHSIKNSAGTLALHLVGNLNHFVGHILGNADYVRDRAFEFSGTVVARTIIIEKIEQTIALINSILPNFSTERMNQIYEFNFLGEQSTAFYLMHFATHFTYHLGQINYHRRLLAEEMM